MGRIVPNVEIFPLWRSADAQRVTNIVISDLLASISPVKARVKSRGFQLLDYCTSGKVRRSSRRTCTKDSASSGSHRHNHTVLDCGLQAGKRERARALRQSMVVDKKFLDTLVRYRFRSKREIAQLFASLKTAKPKRPEYIKGVHNGVYFRIKLPPARKLPNVPPLPPPQQAPKSFRHTVDAAAANVKTRQMRLQEWWKNNWAVLLLNFGSVCSLFGFTRSDVIELRTFSIVGGICGMIYMAQVRPFRATPIVWGMMFGSVNAYNIYKTYQERTGSVRLTKEQEKIYIDLFMPHGVTPREFWSIYEKAKTVTYRKGTAIVRQGEKLTNVYVIVNGHTRASVLGRRVSAASILPDRDDGEVEDIRKRATAGAWIGEMEFLEKFFLTEQRKLPTVGASEEERRETKTFEKNVNEDTDVRPPLQERRTVRLMDVSPARQGKSLYTVIATDDCTVMQWSHKDMAELMEFSNDMRAALTRAMTSAIVAKVVHFTVSRSHAKTWSSLLGDWAHNDAVVKVQDDEGHMVEEKLPKHHAVEPA